MALEQFLVDEAQGTYDQIRDHLVILHVDQDLGKPSDAAELLGHLAEAQRRVGNGSEALRLFSRSLQLWRRLGVPNRMCWCLWGIGSTLRVGGRLAESLPWFRAALRLAESSGERRCQAWAYAELAEVDRIAGWRAR